MVVFGCLMVVGRGVRVGDIRRGDFSGIGDDAFSVNRRGDGERLGLAERNGADGPYARVVRALVGRVAV